MGFSKYCDPRPKWCIPVTASGMHSVCVCEQHQNAKLITAVIPGSHDYEDLLEKIVCSMNDRNCMLHLCESDLFFLFMILTLNIQTVGIHR